MNDHAQPAAVEIRIEELVLHGFAPGERLRIASAIEAALTRLFAERGLPVALTRPGMFAEVQGGAFPARPGSRPEQIGAWVADAVYEGLNG
jgi:hypothetical protein